MFGTGVSVAAAAPDEADGGAEWRQPTAAVYHHQDQHYFHQADQQRVQRQPLMGGGGGGGGGHYQHAQHQHSIPDPHHYNFKRKGQLVGGGVQASSNQIFFANEPMTGNVGVVGYVLKVLSLLMVLFTLPVSVWFCFKVVQEYERAVIFRLGRLVPGGAKGPGVFFVIPCIDTYRKVDLRVLSFDVPPQEILSKDSVTVAVDVVVYFRIRNATISVTNVEDCSRSTKLVAQTTLRNILGTKTLSEMLSDREQISLQMQTSLDEATIPWGVKVERVEMKDMRLPLQLQRSMATEAEAARAAGAKVIAAEGEQKASKALSEAAVTLAQSSAAIQLRYLQTLNSISSEKNRTVIFPFPLEIIRWSLRRNGGMKQKSLKQTA